MHFPDVFHLLKIISLSKHHGQGILCFFISFTIFVLSNCDVDSEYLLKAHKVIEAVPRALNRHNSDTVPAALFADGKSSDPCSDRYSYEAIRTLHRQLDDDASGDIDLEESDEFLRDELKYENGYERHKEFHGDDKSISVDELWQSWKASQVHNWTVDETIDWLLSAAELPEYEHSFRNNGVDGTCLPRLAINSNSFLSGRLGIKDSIHRHKIALKAMDVVLFGPSKRHNFLKDAVLAVAIVLATGGCWFAYAQHKYSQSHMQKMMKDMELLQKAEDALQEIQQELNRARQQQEMVNIEKQDLERRLQDEMKISCKSQGGKMLYMGSDQIRLRELEEQLRSAQSSLHEAEMRLGARSWVAPPTLQHWLQLTHELELKNYNKKKAIAEQQLNGAKEGCEKLRKKRSTFMGAFRITHGGSIDDIDDRIIQAKAALSEVTSDLQERMHRWKEVERLCGVPIIQNSGMAYLEALLRPTSVNGTAGALHSGLLTLAQGCSEGALVHEESPPPYAAGISAVKQLVHTSASMFLVPVRPALAPYTKEADGCAKRMRYLLHQDSGISLTSNMTLVSTNYAINALLPNIPPPPKYSKSSPLYVRKPSTTVLPESLHGSSNSLALSRDNSAMQYSSSSFQDILEVPPEEGYNSLDFEEEITEGSMTPHSCSSYSTYSDGGRTAQPTEDVTNDYCSDVHASCQSLSQSGSLDVTQKELDEQSSELANLCTGLSKTVAHDDAGDDKSEHSSASDTKKKKKSGFVNIFKNSFSSSNLRSAETLSDSTLSVPDGKQKRKKFFRQLLLKK